MFPDRREQKQETETKAEAEAEAETINLPYLPEPIVVHILSKLPVKSLLRFRCVSKSWLSLISDTKFSLTSKREQVMIMISHRFSRNSDSTYLIDAEKASEIDLPKQLTEAKPHVMVPKIMGSCNGLVLLSYVNDLLLWNPSTRCCNRVLSYDMNYEYRSSRIYSPTVVSGLCYDSSLGIYKAVVASRDYNLPYEHVSVSVGCFENKTWTEIPFPYNRHKVEPGPTVNGRLHWMVTNLVSGYRENFIVCYDPKTNEFVTMPMPQCWESDKEITLLGLGVLDGCLSMALCHGNKSCIPNEIEVIVMKKYDDVTSWTSLFVIPETTRLQRIGLLVPLCHMSKGEVLIQCDNRLVVYDRKRRFWYRGFYVPNDCNGKISAIAFVESLESTIEKKSKKFSIQG